MTDSSGGHELFAAVAGGVVTYFFGWWQSWRDRIRRRKATATALLIELRLLDVCLREMYEQDHPANKLGGPTLPMHDTLREQLLLFRPETVAVVLKPYGYLTDIRARLDALEKGTVARSEYWDEDLRWLAYVGVMDMPAARTALLSEGAKLVNEDLRKGIPFPLPRDPLPPSAFYDSRPDTRNRGSEISDMPQTERKSRRTALGVF